MNQDNTSVAKDQILLKCTCDSQASSLMPMIYSDPQVGASSFSNLNYNIFTQIYYYYYFLSATLKKRNARPQKMSLHRAESDHISYNGAR